MKLSQVTAVAALVAKRTTLAEKIATLRTEAITVTVGQFEIVLTNEAAEGLRSRILSSAILDFEKINEQLAAAGVEL